MPDALPLLLYPQLPEADIDEAFPDYPFSWNPLEYAGPRGPNLEGIFLADLTPVTADEEEIKEPTSCSPGGTAEASVVGTTRLSAATGRQGRIEKTFPIIRIAAINLPTLPCASQLGRGKPLCACSL